MVNEHNRGGKKMKRILAAMAIAIVVALAAGGAARAEVMTWKFTSLHPNIVDVKLFDKSHNLVWPAGGNVWSLKDDNAHTVRINCTPGNRICYGAAVRGTGSSYWGIGLDGRQGCQTCCYVCGRGDPPPIRMNPR